jgi:hypothetical protein
MLKTLRVLAAALVLAVVLVTVPTAPHRALADIAPCFGGCFDYAIYVVS